MNPQDLGPFTIFTFIAGPAVLTNASSVLALSTANRFSRAIDRARELTRMLEADKIHEPEVRALWQEMLGRTHRAGKMLLFSMSCSYVALGSFAGATLLSVLAAVVSLHGNQSVGIGILTAGFVVGTVGFFGLVAACVAIVREVFLTLANVSKESRVILAQSPIGKGMAADEAAIPEDLPGSTGPE